MMAGKFVLYSDKAGKFRFRLKAGNGEIIAVSEAYESKASAKTASSRCARTPGRNGRRRDLTPVPVRGPLVR